MSIMSKMAAPLRAVPGVNKLTKQVSKVPGMGAVAGATGMRPPQQNPGIGPSQGGFGNIMSKMQAARQQPQQGPQINQMAQNMGRFGGGMFGGGMQRPMQPQLPPMEAPSMQAPQEPQTGEPVQQAGPEQDQAIQNMQNMQQNMQQNNTEQIRGMAQGMAQPSVMPRFGGQAQMGQGIGPRPQMFGNMMSRAPQMMGRGMMGGMRGMF